MKISALLLALLLPAVLPGVARAQDPHELPGESQLVHLDTPFTLTRGLFAGRVDIRLFGGDEDLVYTSLGLHYGLGDGWEGILRGSFAERKQFALAGGNSIRHGGNDIELLVKWQPAGTTRFAGLIGVAFPDTPAQRDAVLTLGATTGTSAGDRVSLFLHPRAIFLEDNTIFGIGLGAHVRFAGSTALVADWTPVLSGDNTRRTSDGSRRRCDIYGVALRFGAPDGRVAFDVGYGNGVGSTSGFGLTPGLGGSGAFFASLTLRR
jgi:hypothetical protein